MFSFVQECNFTGMLGLEVLGMGRVEREKKEPYAGGGCPCTSWTLSQRSHVGGFWFYFLSLEKVSLGIFRIIALFGQTDDPSKVLISTSTKAP